MGFKAITPAIVRALHTQYNGIYQKAYDEAVPRYPEITTFAPSTSKDNTYGWMAKIPQMREWIGERHVHRLAGHGFKIVNKKFELTLAVDRDDYDDDNLGQYTPVTAAIGEEARKHPDTLLFDLMINGHTADAECFDGQNFFDTDHPEDLFDESNATTYSNYRTSMTLSDTNLFAMRAAMAGFCGENGRPLRVVPNLLVVPPALEKTALDIVVAATVSTGGANVASTLGMKVMVVEELGGDSTKDKTWYLLDTRKAIKPFVYQLRRPTAFVQKFSESDQNVVMLDEYLWAASGRYNVGYGPWFLALKAVGS
jgi:phage major head subunit gpT-like protein